jgi:hypothetical protein
MMARIQSIIGTETRQQMQEAEGRLPDSLVACIGAAPTRWDCSICSSTIRRDLWRRSRGPGLTQLCRLIAGGPRRVTGAAPIVDGR